MATKDEILSENDDEIELVEVETLPEPAKAPKVEAKADYSGSDDQNDADDGEDGEDDEEETSKEDARLAEREEPEEKSDNQRRRARAKEKKRRDAEELTFLRRTVVDLSARVGSVEGANLASSENQVELRLSEVRKDIATAEIILARAIEEGKGDDAAASIRLRDEAKAQEADLLLSKQQISEARKPKESSLGPQAHELRQQFLSANSWINAQGYENATAVVMRLDAEVMSAGYDPNARGYWDELARRINAQSAQAEPARREPAREEAPRRRAPPLGNGREHAPERTRREVYVTPERKQAMIDAGYWDDPSERNKMLKAYADFDRDQSAR